MEDKAWRSIYVCEPNDKEIVTSRMSGEKGHCSATVWDSKTKTFRTYKSERNRFEITIWKHDEWHRN